jgi:hypothetical protein
MGFQRYNFGIFSGRIPAAMVKLSFEGVRMLLNIQALAGAEYICMKECGGGTLSLCIYFSSVVKE